MRELVRQLHEIGRRLGETSWPGLIVVTICAVVFIVTLALDTARRG